MQPKAALFLLAVAAGPAVAVIFGGTPAKPVSASPSASAPAGKAKNATAADVAKLHRKMETVAVALEGMLSAKDGGSLANTKMAPAMRSFVAELRTTLTATASPKDIPAAMTKLKNAQAGMAVLTRALTAQQESLMHEDDVEETNLLLGVLMTRRGEPMEKQLEVLGSPDFSGLPVSKALLAKHDDKTPLFQQVAEYTDKHGVAANVSDADAKAQRLSKTIAYFEKQADKMEHEDQAMQQLHERRVAKLDKLIKEGGKMAHRFVAEKKHADRDYKKRSITHRQQTKVMKDIVAALKRGDAAALRRAQEALQKQMRAAQERTGSFLYLVQLGHRLSRRDCPYCVAQCIGKCHDGGSPYAQCMVQCADAGH